MERRKDISKVLKESLGWDYTEHYVAPHEFRLYPLSSEELVKGFEEWWSKSKHIFWEDNFGGRMKNNSEKEETANSLGCYCECSYQAWCDPGQG